jgi:inhibitor of cysteine peptidase
VAPRLKGLVLALALLMVTACGAGVGVATSSASEVTVTERDDRGNVALASTQTLVVRLSVTLGTGFSWQVVSNNAPILKQSGPARIESPERPIPGAVQQQVFRFTPGTKGSTVLELHDMRPWEKGVKPAKTYSVTVTVR